MPKQITSMEQLKKEAQGEQDNGFSFYSAAISEAANELSGRKKKSNSS